MLDANEFFQHHKLNVLSITLGVQISMLCEAYENSMYLIVDKNVCKSTWRM